MLTKTLSDKEKALVFSALMHDIGKPISWLQTNHPVKKELRSYISHDVLSEYSHQHELYGIALIKKWINENKLRNAPKGLEWMLRHHTPKKGDTGYGIHYSAPELKLQEVKEISNIVSDADKISSESERVSLGSFDGNYNGRWFVNPFMEVSLSKDQVIDKDTVSSWIQTGKVYNTVTVGDFVKGTAEMNLENIVYDMIRNFDFDFNAFDVDYLISFLMYYTMFLPSASPYRTYVLPDVSLFAHLKLTAALSHIIHKNRDGVRIYVGDISGIQSFISDTPKKHAAKILKAKSTYIKIVENAVSRAIISWHGLTNVNILFSSGGKLYVLTDIKNNAEDMLKEIQKEIFKKTNGKLHVTLTYEDFTLNDIRKGMGILDRVENKLRHEKEKKYWRIKDVIFSGLEEVFDEEQCAICGRAGRNRNDDIDDTFYLCNDCNEIWDLAKSVKFLSQDFKSASRINIGTNGKVRFSFNFDEGVVDVCYSVSNGTGFLPFPSEQFTDKFMFVSVSYPLDGNSIKPFDKFSEDNKIYVLKGDVDNLGFIFSKGLRNTVASGRRLDTLSRQLTLSYILDMFFSGRLTYLASKYNSIGNNIYVLFSGGDDFTIIGDKSVIDFLQELLDEFNKLVMNDEITFSASISRHRSKTPFKDTYKKSELSLNLVKTHPLLTIPMHGYRKKGIVHMIWFDKFDDGAAPLSYGVETQEPSMDFMEFFDNSGKIFKIKHFLDKLVRHIPSSPNNWDFYRLHYYIKSTKSEKSDYVRTVLLNASTDYKIGLDLLGSRGASNMKLRSGLSVINVIRARLKLLSEEGEKNE